MTEQPSEDMKHCPYCGKMTSTKANFCYYCTRQLISRPERPTEDHKPLRIPWLWVGIGVVVVLGILLLVAFH